MVLQHEKIYISILQTETNNRMECDLNNYLWGFPQYTVTLYSMFHRSEEFSLETSLVESKEND